MTLQHILIPGIDSIDDGIHQMHRPSDGQLKTGQACQARGVLIVLKVEEREGGRKEMSLGSKNGTDKMSSVYQ